MQVLKGRKFVMPFWGRLIYLAKFPERFQLFCSVPSIANSTQHLKFDNLTEEKNRSTVGPQSIFMRKLYKLIEISMKRKKMVKCSFPTISSKHYWLINYQIMTQANHKNYQRLNSWRSSLHSSLQAVIQLPVSFNLWSLWWPSIQKSKQNFDVRSMLFCKMKDPTTIIKVWRSWSMLTIFRRKCWGWTPLLLACFPGLQRKIRTWMGFPFTRKPKLLWIFWAIITVHPILKTRQFLGPKDGKMNVMSFHCMPIIVFQGEGEPVSVSTWQCCNQRSHWLSF